MESLAKYSLAFGGLHADAVVGRWSASTMHRAPHKALLLLSVADLYAANLMRANLIQLTDDLVQLFNRYWTVIMGWGAQTTIALPFFHMRSEGFWHLVAKPGQESIISTSKQMRSITRMRETILGAVLDEDLHMLLLSPTAREQLRNVLIEKNFANGLHAELIQQGVAGPEIIAYSEDLLEHARTGTGEEPKVHGTREQIVRTQGFRRAVVLAYDNRCAICGIRVITPEGYTAVDAAHIVPWRLSHDDDPRNGLALCRLCHWAFDTGLVGVSSRYTLLASSQLSGMPNLPGHLSAIVGRGLLGPEERQLWPTWGPSSGT